MNFLPLIIATVGYFTIHSILASETVKAFAAKLFQPKYYRLFFNFVALVTLLPIIFIFIKTENRVLFDFSFLKILGIGFSLAGLFFGVKALRSYDLGEFSGTAQLQTGSDKIIENLNTSGMNSYVRHPLYFATLLLIWGMFLIFPKDTVLVLVVITNLYLIVGTKLEENKLVNDFGEVYLDYQKRVPMLLPNIFRY